MKQTATLAGVSDAPTEPVESDWELTSPTPTGSQGDLKDAELEMIGAAASTHYEQGCPASQRTCGAGTPCVQTC